MSLEFPERTSRGLLVTEDPLADFRNFLFLVWEHLRLPAPTPVQYDIAQYLQTGPKRIIIEAFRGVGKSWVTSAFVCWLLYMNPQWNILVVSASKTRADDFTTFTRRLIDEMDVLHHLRPGTSQRDSKIAFDVGPARASHAPSVKSVGITGQIAGSRADVIVADDIEVPNNSMTEAMRQKLAEAVKEFDAVLKPGGRVVYLGTPQTEMSLYNKLPSRGYEVRIWPARYPDRQLREWYGDRLAPMIDALTNDLTVGNPTDSVRFSDLDLLEREASYGRSGFAMQFMLNTAMSDANRFPLKVADLLVIERMDHHRGFENLVWASGRQQALDHLPCVGLEGDAFYRPMEMAGGGVEFTGSVMFIDPSGRGKDETGYAVVKSLHSFLYVTRCGGLPGGYDAATLQALADIAKDEKVSLIQIESNFGGGMFAQLLEPYLTRTHPVTVEEVHSSVQKEKRIIDTLEPVMNQHRLVFDSRVIEDDYASVQDRPTDEGYRYSLIYQMTRITRERGALANDDRLDALAGAVAYWVDQMDLDARKLMASREEELLHDEIAKTVEAANLGFATLLGHTPDVAGSGLRWA